MNNKNNADIDKLTKEIEKSISNPDTQSPRISTASPRHFAVDLSPLEQIKTKLNTQRDDSKTNLPDLEYNANKQTSVTTILNAINPFGSITAKERLEGEKIKVQIINRQLELLNEIEKLTDEKTAYAQQEDLKQNQIKLLHEFQRLENLKNSSTKNLNADVRAGIAAAVAAGVGTAGLLFPPLLLVASGIAIYIVIMNGRVVQL